MEFSQHPTVLDTKGWSHWRNRFQVTHRRIQHNAIVSVAWILTEVARRSKRPREGLCYLSHQTHPTRCPDWQWPRQCAHWLMLGPQRHTDVARLLLPDFIFYVTSIPAVVCKLQALVISTLFLKKPIHFINAKSLLDFLPELEKIWKVNLVYLLVFFGGGWGGVIL